MLKFELNAKQKAMIEQRVSQVRQLALKQARHLLESGLDYVAQWEKMDAAPATIQPSSFVNTEESPKAQPVKAKKASQKPFTTQKTPIVAKIHHRTARHH